MDRLRRAALLTRLVQALLQRGSWAGETHIQKASFLLQELLGVNLEFHFVLYLYGPFSFDLRDELASLRADDFIQMVPQSPPYGPRYKILEQQTNYIQKLFPKTLEQYDAKIQFVADKFGSSGVAKLERLATAYYVKKKFEGISSADLKSELIQVKPHISYSEAEEAFNTITSIEEQAALLH